VRKSVHFPSNLFWQMAANAKNISQSQFSLTAPDCFFRASGFFDLTLFANAANFFPEALNAFSYLSSKNAQFFYFTQHKK
jgi:hypothetical protein